MKKDADIAKIFEQAETETEIKRELLTPALYELQKRNARQKAKKRTAVRVGAFACAAAAVIISLSVLLPRFFKGGGGEQDPSAPVYYSASEVTPSGTVGADIKAALPVLTHINGDAVLPENITEYRFSDGTAAYVSAKFRRRGRFGIEDVTVTAEFANDVCETFGEFYPLLSGGDFDFISGYEDGEHIGKCAARKDGVKFYVDIMSAERIDFDYYKNVFVQ